MDFDRTSFGIALAVIVFFMILKKPTAFSKQKITIVLVIVLGLALSFSAGLIILAIALALFYVLTPNFIICTNEKPNKIIGEVLGNMFVSYKETKGMIAAKGIGTVEFMSFIGIKIAILKPEKNSLKATLIFSNIQKYLDK